MLLGIGALVLGVAITLASVGSGTGGSAATIGFLAGSAVAGFGFGSGFQGGIRMVMPQAEPHERAGLLSLLYVVSYLGFGIPAVIGGVLVVHGGGLLQTAQEYGIAVIVLSIAALTGLLLSKRRARPRAELQKEASRASETVPAPDHASVLDTRRSV
jgi:MFS family permease